MRLPQHWICIVLIIVFLVSCSAPPVKTTPMPVKTTPTPARDPFDRCFTMIVETQIPRTVAGFQRAYFDNSPVLFESADRVNSRYGYTATYSNGEQNATMIIYAATQSSGTIQDSLMQKITGGNLTYQNRSIGGFKFITYDAGMVMTTGIRDDAVVRGTFLNMNIAEAEVFVKAFLTALCG